MIVKFEFINIYQIFFIFNQLSIKDCLVIPNCKIYASSIENFYHYLKIIKKYFANKKIYFVSH